MCLCPCTGLFFYKFVSVYRSLFICICSLFLYVSFNTCIDSSLYRSLLIHLLSLYIGFLSFLCVVLWPLFMNFAPVCVSVYRSLFIHICLFVQVSFHSCNVSLYRFPLIYFSVYIYFLHSLMSLGAGLFPFMSCLYV